MDLTAFTPIVMLGLVVFTLVTLVKRVRAREWGAVLTVVLAVVVDVGFEIALPVDIALLVSAVPCVP